MRATKRLLDICLAAIGLLLLSPVLLVGGLAVRLSMGAPILFRQERAGENGEPFTLLKFRTMRDARNEQGDLLPDSARTTTVGRVLRNTSLDELPQFWNVLRGEMSLVGPRPHPLEHLRYYREDESLRLSMRPGMTSLPGVLGRNLLSWDDRLALDVEYVRKWSLSLDLWIAWRTLWVILTAHGASTTPASDSLHERGPRE
jgi:lipopolysaccharide/colanic/teichoic acid biosynthesis glycosyltransferase